MTYPAYNPDSPPSGFHYTLVVDPVTGGTLDITVPAHNLCSAKDAAALAAELNAELVDLVPVVGGVSAPVHLLGSEDRVFKGLKGIPGTPKDQPIGPNGEEVYCANLLELKYHGGVGAPGHWENTGGGFVFDASHSPVWVDDPPPAPAPAPVNTGGELPAAFQSGNAAVAEPTIQDVLNAIADLKKTLLGG